MNSRPLVSILMTAYNRETFIVEAIESVLSNSYTNIELIIVDDGSNDNTVAIAKRFEKIDNRVKVFVNSQNMGDYPNRNRAASLANGEFMMYVDSDDKLNFNTISKILFSDEIIRHLNFAMFWHHSNNIFSLNGDEALRIHFCEKQFLYFGPGGTFIRKSFFAAIGGYPEKYGPANDMYFNLKACTYSSIHLYPFEFIFYRFHVGQELNNKLGYLYNNYLYLRDAFNHLKLPFNNSEIEILHKKNKRRFIVNLFKYFFSTFNFPKTIYAIKKTGFNLNDLIVGIFH